jgi:Zn-dependent peptidase ImmA (M78 family)
LKPLAASVADDTNDNKRTGKQWTKCQRFVKLKELQAETQANAFAAHLILPNRTQSPPTTRPVDG